MAVVNRKPHRLRSEKTLAMPRHIICFDTETDQFTDPQGNITHTLKLGWACYFRRATMQRAERREWCYFTDAPTFWRFVFDKAGSKNKLWVCAHNISFDFVVSKGMQFLNDNGYKSQFLYSNGITTIFKVRCPGKSIVFVDTLNWFPETLAKLGDRLGIPKLGIDFDTADVESLKTYCHRDVEIIIEAIKSLMRFLEGNRIARLCYTIGATALAAFRLRGYKGNIFIHNNQKAMDLERESYLGGRTEAFYIGELNNGPYYVVDVNSLYPSVMAGNKYPVRYVKMLPRCTVKRLADALKKYSIIAKVLVSTDVPVYALKQERTIFPVGRFWVTLTTPDLLYALGHNHIEQIERCVFYEQDNIFAKYVTMLYTLRQDFDSAGVPMFAHFCKIMLNSLYGKFGQRADVWTKIGKCPGEIDRIEDVFDAVTHTRKQLRYLLGELFERTGMEETRDSFPAIASQVTAYGRRYLYELMGVCGEGNYFYCDTDSLFVNQIGLDNLSDRLNNTGIGGLKVESVTDTITIHGLKDYVTQNKTTLKGIRKTATQTGPNQYTQERWPSFKGCLRAGSPDTYTVKQVTKTLTRSYTKGVVTKTGWVNPFCLDVVGSSRSQLS